MSLCVDGADTKSVHSLVGMYLLENVQAVRFRLGNKVKWV